MINEITDALLQTNIAWRDSEAEWVKFQKVSDLFMVLPAKHAAPLARALDESVVLDQRQHQHQHQEQRPQPQQQHHRQQQQQQQQRQTRRW